MNTLYSQKTAGTAEKLNISGGHFVCAGEEDRTKARFKFRTYEPCYLSAPFFIWTKGPPGLWIVRAGPKVFISAYKKKRKDVLA